MDKRIKRKIDKRVVKVKTDRDKIIALIVGCEDVLVFYEAETDHEQLLKEIFEDFIDYLKKRAALEQYNHLLKISQSTAVGISQLIGDYTPSDAYKRLAVLGFIGACHKQITDNAVYE